eukprot:CAMPEP_0114544374 /NCGR_PEP_ID=MMETSP0114-20121206/2841_1 /TAXON_ID=31324 /ORGANISM="Goniomonas sp, Strain m" /LENGTH=492 /DNA_ID=CAMNT_0001728747 /DNA_START=214 /DNA_END=1692 /DNA_ORIENTATION=+
MEHAIMQTDEVIVKERACQSKDRADAGGQTDVPEYSCDGEGVQTGGLEAFLARVAPMMEDQIESNLKSHAFEGYEVEWEEQRTTVVHLHTLTRPVSKDQTPMPVSCVSWNANGQTLAIGYGCMDHQDLCSHRAYICAWNLSRKFIKEDCPDTVIESPACVMSLAFHPTDPGLLASGSFNGGVLLWRVGQSDSSPIAENVLSRHGHREPVMQLTWMYDALERSHSLLSVAADGNALMWSQANNLAVPTAALELTVGSAARAGLSRGYKRGRNMGGTAVGSFSKDPGSFVVGTESGGLLKCLVNFSEITARRRGKDPTEPPTTGLGMKVTFAFEAHAGPVFGVSCSPFARKVFLSVSADCQLRLYNTLRASPIVTLEPSPAELYSTAWSFSRPLVFAAGTADGHVHVYDLGRDRVAPAVRLSTFAEEGDKRDKTAQGKAGQGKAVYSVAFNHVFSELLAAGDAQGSVRVWQLPSHLSLAMAGEEASLEFMSEHQ